MAASKVKKKRSSTLGGDEASKHADQPMIRSIGWTAAQWAEYVGVQPSRLRMLRLQDVAEKMAIHENTIRNLYDPASDGFDPEFPTPVTLTNAPKARAKGFIEWEIEAYLVLQVLRTRGLDLSALDGAKAPSHQFVTEGSDHQPELKPKNEQRELRNSIRPKERAPESAPSELAASLRNLCTPK